MTIYFSFKPRQSWVTDDENFNMLNVMIKDKNLNNDIMATLYQ